MIIDKGTTIYVSSDISPAVEYAITALRRDMDGVFGCLPDIADVPSINQIRIKQTDLGREEAFRVSCGQDDAFILLEGHDDLGLIFAIYNLTETVFEVDPFYFWTDFKYVRNDGIDVAPFVYDAPVPRIRYRGWFINGEDLLRGWHDDMEISLDTWSAVFETMLRAGFNMVIPGTAVWAGDPQVQLASEMGLWITHHHTEPLGARMFIDAWPGQKPKYPEDRDKIFDLYRDAINLSCNMKVVWTVGLRGQGDSSFTYDDERYSDPSDLGRLLTEVIREQKALVNRLHPGANTFVHNLYAESAALYQQGYLELDDDVIRVWGDNGFGVMCPRREIGPETGVAALPEEQDRNLKHGVYYHVNFHNLQNSNQLVPLVDPVLIGQEFEKLYKATDHVDYLTLNVGNIRPHIFDIELVGRIVRTPGNRNFTPDETVKKHYARFTARHFSGFEAETTELIARYYSIPFTFDNLHERAGEQVYHFLLRDAIAAVLNPPMTEDVIKYSLGLIGNRGTTLSPYFAGFIELAEPILSQWKALTDDIAVCADRLPERALPYFRDSILCHAQYMYASCRGFVNGLNALLDYLQEDYQSAFVLASNAKRDMNEAWQVLTMTAHGKWKHFYRGEHLTGTQETIRMLRTLQGMAKIMGDSIFKSRWAVECVNFSRPANVLSQPKPDYDILADAIVEARHVSGADNYDLFRR